MNTVPKDDDSFTLAKHYAKTSEISCTNYTCPTQHNDIQHNDSQHKGVICDIQHKDTQHNNTANMPNSIILSVVFYSLLC